MAPLNGLRFLSIAWVILGHRYFFVSSSFPTNELTLLQWFRAPITQLLTGGVLAVDTFFFLSGLLNSYHLLKLLDKTKRFPGVMFYVHRYLRTTPALAAMILIYSSWYTLIGDGPIWDRTNAHNKQLCLDNWWPTLLYINNYYNPITQCAGQSWYLAVDMQLYWISPLIILPLWKWPKFGKYYLGVLLLISTVVQFVIAYVYKIRMTFSISQDLEEYQKVTEYMYVPTHTRATPYIMGLMLGKFLHYLNKNNKPLRMKKVTVVFGWLFSTALCLTVVLGNYQLFQSETEYPYDRLQSSFYIAFHRIAWSIGIGWVIVACLYGYGGIVNDILSSKLFVPLSRLTYCIFLTHMAVQNYQIGTTRNNEYTYHFNQVHRFFGDLVMAVFVAALLSLMFESPFMNLEKILFSRKSPTEKQPRNEEKVGRENEGFESEK